VVNGDLARGTLHKRVSRVKGCMQVGRFRETETDRLMAQGDERSSSSGFGRRLKRSSGSRNRDRKITGFYEESLSMEGIPGCTSQ